MMDALDDYDLAFDRAILSLQSAIPDLDDEAAADVVTSLTIAVLETLKHVMKEQTQ